MRLLVAGLVALVGVWMSGGTDLATQFDVETGLSGCDYWAGLKRHPARVDEFGRENDPNLLSLNGTWEFCTAPHGSGRRTGFFRKHAVWPNTRTIEVPDCWENQGVGEEGMGKPFLCQDQSPKRLRHVFVGEGHYRKTVRIPSSWTGKRIWLKTGGVSSVGWFYVNDHAVAMIDAYAGAFKYDVTAFVRPGEEARVVAVADNAVGSRSGIGTCNRWGGLTGSVELEATPMTCIDDVWVRGDFDGRKAEVKVEVEGQERREGLVLRATVEGEIREIALRPAPTPSTYTLELPLRQFRPWSPEHPNLYTARVELVSADGAVLQTRFERFGVRKLEARGKELYFNGRPFFLRGCGHNQAYPLTGMSPHDREFHRRQMRVIKESGFNSIRLHTHMERQAFFDAADEMGILVQPELPYYLDNADDGFSYDPVRDAYERWRAFRHHPSYVIDSQGNEGLLGPAADRLVRQFLKRLDPDRFVIGEDGVNTEAWEDAGNESLPDFVRGPHSAFERGSFNPPAPFVCHEYLNLAVKTDARLEGDYTGVWLPPTTRRERAAWLARFGLGAAFGDRLQDAQHSLQAFWFRRGIEIARVDPNCDGYCYWTISDSTVFSRKTNCYTAQGLFTPFMRPKRASLTPSEVARFNAPSCILLDECGMTPEIPPLEHYSIVPNGSGRGWTGTNRVFRSGETLPLEFVLSHYAEQDLTDARLDWSLVTTGGRTLASGGKDLGFQTAGPAKTVERACVVIPPLARSTKAVLTATVTSRTSQAFSASWDFWLFPRTETMACARQRAAELGVVIAPSGSSEAQAAVAAGRPLVSLANQTGCANAYLGWWWIGSQCGMVVENHPALKHLPYEPFLSPLLMRIVKEGTPLPVADVGEKDLIVVGEGGTACYLYLAERKHASGSREMLVSGLDLTSETPEGAALLRGLVEYAAGGREGGRP